MKDVGGHRSLLLFPGTLGDFLCFLPAAIALAEQEGGAVLVARSTWLSLVAHPRLSGVSFDHPEVVRMYAGVAAGSARRDPVFAGVRRVFSWSGAHIAGFERLLAETFGAAEVHVFPFLGTRAGQHATEYYAACLGVRPAEITREMLRLTPRPQGWEGRALGARCGPTLFLHTGSGSAEKNWLGYGELARRWRKDLGGVVVEIRGPAETEHGQRLPEANIVLENLELCDLAGCLNEAPLYVGNDTGVSHLAALLVRHAVVLFGPTDPATWAPRGSNTRILFAPLACESCGPRKFCTHRLSVETVWAELLVCLNAPIDGVPVIKP